MKKNRLLLFIFIIFSFLLSCSGKKQTPKQKTAEYIQSDKTLSIVDSMARILIKEGFNAGSGYSQIWARDLNTFIETAIEETPQNEIREAILIFFRLQQKNGEMVDGYVLKEDFTWNDNTPYYSEAAPKHVGFKNTVETDQETSLIQLIGKYVRKTGDTSLLDENIAGISVMERIEAMIDYLLKERYNKKYGLLWGAMTADWGDVQPNDDFGCDWNELSHQAIDVYDNAMFIIALDYLSEMSRDESKKQNQIQLRKSIAENVRLHLWDTERKKFIPHIYPETSPIPEGFNENDIHYHGGTAVAIEAGLLTKEEIEIVYKQMADNVKKSGMPSIGLTIFPAYPEGFFRGGMSKPYIYQNGGDWTWFGGRMIQQLAANGFIEEAYKEIRPMIDRVIKNQGFYEWYGMGGVPSGSGKFKGSAGVLSKAIGMLYKLSEENK